MGRQKDIVGVQSLDLEAASGRQLRPVCPAASQTAGLSAQSTDLNGHRAGLSDRNCSRAGVLIAVALITGILDQSSPLGISRSIVSSEEGSRAKRSAFCATLPL